LHLSGRWLIDGGVVNTLPADVVAGRGAEVVVAVDVSARLEPEPQTAVDILLRSYAITAKELVRVKLSRVREAFGGRFVLIRPRVEEIGVLEFERAAEALEAGRAAAREAIPRVLAALEL
jgi:NTE family protein